MARRAVAEYTHAQAVMTSWLLPGLCSGKPLSMGWCHFRRGSSVEQCAPWSQCCVCFTVASSFIPKEFLFLDQKFCTVIDNYGVHMSVFHRWQEIMWILYTFFFFYLFLNINIQVEYFFYPRCIWWTFAGIHGQPGEGKINHESHLCKFASRK